MKRRRFVSSARIVLEGERFRARLIEEGTSKNGNVWTRRALEDMVPLVEGAPVHIYDFSEDGSGRRLSHWGFIWRALPPAIRTLLPERLTDATVAHVRNARLVQEGGRAAIEADLELVGERASAFRSVLEAAQRLGRSLGISVHVPEGGLEESRVDRRLRRIERVSKVLGFDLVSFPSAGGRVVPVLEALGVGGRRMKRVVQRLLRLVTEEKRAALEGKIPKAAGAIDTVAAFLESEELSEFRGEVLEALEIEEVAEEALEGVLEAMLRVVPEDDDANAGKAKGKAKSSTRKPAAAARRAVLEDDDPEPEPETVPAWARGFLANARRAVMEAEIAAAKLPKGLAEFARKRLPGILEGLPPEDDGSATVRDFVADLKKGLGDSQDRGALEGGRMGHDPRVEMGWSSGEKIEAALEALLAGDREAVLPGANGAAAERVPAFQGIRHAYQVITGDALMQGAAYYERRQRGPSILEGYDWEANPFFVRLRSMRGALEAAQETSNFPLLLSNVINKRTLKVYRQLGHVWKLVAKPVPVNDFKSRQIVQFGEVGNLLAVAEGDAYLELAYPTEDDITAAVSKRGGLSKWSWEATVNDDTRKLRMIPSQMARAAERTLNELVWGKIAGNSNIYDGTALFTVGHGNLQSVAYSATTLKTARKQMTRQKDLDAREAGRFIPRRVFVAPELIDTVYEDIGSEGKAQLVNTDTNQAAGTTRTITEENPGKPNVLRTRYGLELVEVHAIEVTAGASDNVYVADDPNAVDMMEVGFLNGQEDPSIFVQDLERVGSFFDADVLTYKVRHVHDGGVVTDFRAFQAIIAP